MIRPYLLTQAERAALRRRTGQAVRLLALLQDYQAEVRQPCQRCGCLLFAVVKGGVRCLRCWPPLEMPERLRQMIEDSMRDQDEQPSTTTSQHEGVTHETQH